MLKNVQRNIVLEGSPGMMSVSWEISGCECEWGEQDVRVRGSLARMLEFKLGKEFFFVKGGLPQSVGTLNGLVRNLFVGSKPN